MKEGWEYKKLGEVCEILDSQRKPITKGKREPGAIPYYGATGCLDYVKDYIFDEKLVLLGEDGAKWGAGDNSAYIINGKSWVNNHAHALRPKRDLLIDELLVYYLNFSNLLPYITGVTVPKLNQEKMRSIEIPIGPLKEQQSIVDYLDSAFAKIDAMKANAEKALGEAKALFQASLKEMLEPKEGWEEKKIGEVCELSQGLAINSKTRCLLKETGQLPLLRIKDLKDGTREIFVDEKNCPQSCIANEDDIIYTRTGTLGLVFTGMKGVLHNNCFKIVYNRGLLEKTFLMFFLGHEAFKSKIIKLASRAAQPDITHKLFKAQEIVFPPISEQQSIVETLDSLKSKVDRLQANYDKISQECDALKQAILRQVFT